MLPSSSPSVLASAQPPRVIVLLVDGLDYSDTRHLQIDDLIDRGAAGLMSVGLAQGSDPVANVYASIGAGDTIHVGDVSEGRLCTALHGAGKRIGVVDDGEVESGSMRYLGPTEDDVVVRGGNSAFLVAEWMSRAVGSLERDDVVVAHLEEGADVAAVLKALSISVGKSERPTRLYFVTATPPAGWDRLAPVYVLNVNPAERGLLTSTTTRTPGLIASRDIAPSILSDLGVPIPIQMTGAPMETTPASAVEVDRTLDHLDRVTYLDQRAQSPFFWALGLVGGIILFTAVGLFVSGRPVNSPWLLYAIRVLCSWPLGLLLAWWFDPHTMTVYLLEIGGVMLVVALLPDPPSILLLTSAVVIVDAFFGSRLVSQAIMSAYMMSGIRFYGIGNEYMGVLIGGALMAPVVFAKRLGAIPFVPSTSTPEARSTLIAHLLLGAFLALTVFVLSFPAYGAKAGGAVTATSTFMFLTWEMRGQKITLGRAVFAIAAGFALVFVWAGISRALHLTPTHIDTAAGAMTSGRFGYIVGVAARKVGLAIRVALHPGTVVGVVALVVMCLVVRALLRERLADLWVRRPEYRAVVAAGLRGSVVAILFNDSGIVAAILLVVSLLLPVLYNIFDPVSIRA